MDYLNMNSLKITNCVCQDSTAEKLTPDCAPLRSFVTEQRSLIMVALQLPAENVIPRNESQLKMQYHVTQATCLSILTTQRK